MLSALLRSARRLWSPRPTQAIRRPLRRQRLQFDVLEDRIAPAASMTFAGLEFMTNGSFDTNGNAVSSSAAVQVGIAPPKGATFTPVLQLDDGVSFMSNDTTGTFTTDGTVSGLAGNPSTAMQLVDAHMHTFTAPGLLSSSGYFSLPDSDANDPHLTVGGGQLAVTALHVAATELDLQGTIMLGSTVGLTVTVAGNDHVAMNTSGVNIAGPDPTVGAETFQFGGVTVMVQSLTVTSNQATGEFDMSGMVTATFADNTVTVNLGNGNTPGLVITNGQVTSFDGSITSNLKFGGVTITTDDLEVAYTAGSDLTITGEASFMFDGQMIGLALGSKGANGTQYPGIDIDPATGNLLSLDAGIQSDVEIADVTFKTEDLGIQYSPGSDFIIKGSAEFDLKDDNSSNMQMQNQMVGITFGGTDNSGTMHSGIDIAPDGTLKSLDAAINADVTVGGAEFKAIGLGVEYDSTTGEIAVYGGASVTFSGNTAQVMLGTSAAPGLVIDSMTGQLHSLNASVTANVNIDGIMLSANGLTVSYMAPQNGNGEMIEIYGDVSVMTSFLNFDANLGSASNPGIEIDNGQLENLNITVTGGFSLDGISLAANGLVIDYNQSMNMLALSGGVTVQFTSAFQFSASLAKGGLLINPTTGALSIDTSNGLEIKANATIGPFSIQNLDISFSNGPNGINFSATGMVMLPDNWGVDLTALTIVNGQLADIGLDITAQIPIGDTGLFLTQFGGELKNLNNPSQLEIDANATIDVGETINIPSIEPFFGGDPTAAVASASGSLMIDASELKLTGSVTILDGLLGQGSATLDLNWGAGVYSISGSFSMYDDLISFSGSLTFDNDGDIDLVATASVNVPAFIPFIGGTSLANINFALHFVNPATHPNADWSDSYVAVWTNVNLFFVNFTIGFKVDFTGNFSIINGNDVAAITAPPPPSTPQPMQYVYSYPLTIPQQPGGVADGTEVTVTAPDLVSEGYPLSPGDDTVTSAGNGTKAQNGDFDYSYQLSHADVLLNSLNFNIYIDEDTVPGGVYDGSGSFNSNGDFVFTPANPDSIEPTNVLLFANGVLGMAWPGNVGTTEITATYEAADASFQLYQNLQNGGQAFIKTYTIDPVTNYDSGGIGDTTVAMPMDAMNTQSNVPGIVQGKFGNGGGGNSTIYSLSQSDVDPTTVTFTLYQGQTKLGTGYFTSASKFTFVPMGAPALVPTGGTIIGSGQISLTWAQAPPSNTSINATYAAGDNRLIEVNLAQDSVNSGIPGSYTLELVASSIGDPMINPSFTQWDQYDPPTARLDGTPTVDANGVLSGNVAVGVYTPDTSSATVSLYYNTTDSLTAGTLIETVPYNSISGANPRVLPFSWNGFADLPAGKYYVYAEVNDGMNQPTYSAVTGPIITTGATPTLGGATSLIVAAGTGGVLQGMFSGNNALTVGPNYAAPVTVSLTLNGGGSIVLPNASTWTQTVDPTMSFVTYSQTFDDDTDANTALDDLQFIAGDDFGGGTTLTFSASVTIPMTSNGMTQQDTLTNTESIPIVTTNTHLVVTQTVSGSVTGATVTSGGSGYQSAPTVTFVSADGLGSGALGVATIQNGAVVGITITNPGIGYDVPPQVVLTGGDPTAEATAATATATILTPPTDPNQAIITITVTNPGGPDGQDGTNVQLQNYLTAGLTLLSATTSTGSFDPTTGLWTISNLPTTGANSATLTLTVQSGAGTDDTALSSSATATSDLPNFPLSDAKSVAFVLPLAHPVVMAPTTLPTPVIGSPYAVQFMADGGGGGPYTFSVTGGALPDGLKLCPSGLLWGTPTGTANFFNLTVAATNGYGASATEAFVAEVANGPLGVVGASFSLTLGPAGDQYSVLGTAPVPPGLSITTSGNNAVLSGTPTTPGSYAFVIANMAPNGGLSYLDDDLYVDPAVVPATPTLPAAVAGTSYSAAFSATGGNGEIFIALAGGALPTGLTLDAGTLNGTVAADAMPGGYPFSLSYTDSSGAVVVDQYTIQVEASVRVNGTTLAATVGNSYQMNLTATGGSGTGYSFSAIELPQGLSLSQSGTLTGMLPPTTPPGPTPISFFVTDSDGGTSMQTINLVVNPPVTVSPAGLPDGLADTTYSATLTAIGGTGTGFTFAVTSDTLPTGLTLSKAGVLGGTIASSAAGGYYTFAVTATDSQGDTGSVTCNLFVDRTLTLSPATLTALKVGVPYSQQLAVTGGSGIYGAFTVGAGSLPAGLTLSAAGLLSGTVLATAPAGMYPFTISVTDTAGMTQSISYALTIAAVNETWTGAASTAWSNPANWSLHMVPGAENNVTIPSHPADNRYPLLDTAATMDNVTLQPGATLTLAGHALTVDGTVTNQGTVVLEGNEDVTLAHGNDVAEGTWRYVGDGTGGTLTLAHFGAIDYFNLTINDSHTHHDTFTTAGPVAVNGALAIASGTFAPATTVTAHGVVLSGTGILDAPATLNDTGNWTVTGGTFKPDGGTVAFTGTGTTQVTSGNKAFANVTHTGTGTVTLLTNPLTIAGAFTDTAGTFRTNNLAVTITGPTMLTGGVFTGSTAAVHFNGGLTLNGGSFAGSTGAVTAAGVTLTAGSLTAPATTLTDTGNWTVTGGTFNAVHGTVVLAGTNQQIAGNTTFFNLTKVVTTADTLTFQAGSTQTVDGTLRFHGASASKRLALRSSSPGTTWAIKPVGSVSVSFVDVADSVNLGKTTLTATGSHNSGDDTGWRFA